jgi:hypothetical protein
MHKGIKNIFVFFGLNIIQKEILKFKHGQDIKNSHKLKLNATKGSTP